MHLWDRSFHSDIGLSVIRSGLWVYTEDVRLVGHENPLVDRKFEIWTLYTEWIPAR